MKRITLVLPDELNALLQQERRQRDVSAATVVRDALEAYFAGRELPRRLPFIALGRSGCHDTSENIDAILAREWGEAGRR